MSSNSFARVNGSHIVACYPEKYDDLLEIKVKKLSELLTLAGSLEISVAMIEVFSSPRENFRMRANFNLYHDDMKNKTVDGAYYVMYDDSDKKKPCEITSFPRGTILMNELMLKLKDLLKQNDILFQNLFEVRFVTTQLNESIVVLCYKKPILEFFWLPVAENAAKCLNTKIIGHSKKVKLVTGEDKNDETIMEVYSLDGKQYKYFQTEGSFSQPNAKVCEKMLSWVLEISKNSHHEDLLELYCGGGTFTIVCAPNFRKVLATEISKSSVELALRAIKINNINNIKIARLSSEEFSQAYSKQRTFTRLESTGIKFEDYNIGTVLVDPPRAGLDIDTCKLISQFNRIIYISCNPETLARDVKVLSSTHTISKVAAFDQFPYTHHLEGGVLLTKTISLPTHDSNDLDANNSKVNLIDSAGDKADDHIVKKPRIESNL
eukprot:gene12687-17010_t